MTQYLFIDFENTQKVKLEEDGGTFDKILIFVGRSQNKLDFELVLRLQSLGSKVEWVKIGGEGKNNLDFHLSYMLGKMDTEADRAIGFVVLSRDKGYDALIRYIVEHGRECRRTDNLGRAVAVRAEAKAEPKTESKPEPRRGRGSSRRPRASRSGQPAAAKPVPAEAGIEGEILSALGGMAADKRPSNKRSLYNYLESQHGAGKTAPPAKGLLEKLLRTGLVYIEEGQVKYRL
ncbi:MAG: hypothetical protein HY927_15895 [Elusimicrobia bacterium]|nr:hypothetical protein [Elusimicrobiota bacterium]